MRWTLRVAATVLAALCGACSRSDDELGHRIANEVAKGAGTVVRMAALTDFPWEKLHVFSPYSTRDHIEAELGFAWPDADGTGIRDNEGIALLVFVKSGAVVRYVAHPRNKGDFTGLRDPGGLSVSEAVFVVTLRFDGWFSMSLFDGGKQRETTGTPTGR